MYNKNHYQIKKRIIGKTVKGATFNKIAQELLLGYVCVISESGG